MMADKYRIILAKKENLFGAFYSTNSK